ncbi:MAG: CooT family nickel-binding protein [Thermoplasmata archaeon]
MCESTVYIERGGEETELMNDVAKIEVNGKTITCIDIMGEMRTVQGTVKRADFVNHRFVIASK